MSKEDHHSLCCNSTKIELLHRWFLYIDLFDMYGSKNDTFIKNKKMYNKR